jgi:hypothetical protein
MVEVDVGVCIPTETRVSVPVEVRGLFQEPRLGEGGYRSDDNSR